MKPLQKFTVGLLFALICLTYIVLFLALSLTEPL